MIVLCRKVREMSLSDITKRLGVTPPPGAPSIDEIEERVSRIKDSIKDAALSTVDLPKTYDLRNVNGKNFITDIKDQKLCGSCVSFATLATVESSIRVQHNDPSFLIDLSEAHLFFCLGHGSASCLNGWWPQQAYELLKNKGVVDEACYEYKDGLQTQDCRGLCTDSERRLTKIKDFKDLTEKVIEIKKWIFEKGPVSACFIVYSDFENHEGVYIRRGNPERKGAHCVSIIGWNDNESCWICKNSWGPEKLENGYFRIGYGECGIDIWLNHGVESF
ncbi:C1 family peptidase [Bacillus cereus]|nr:C1 family peptidase [Bacillus cereus]